MSCWHVSSFPLYWRNGIFLVAIIPLLGNNQNSLSLVVLVVPVNFGAWAKVSFKFGIHIVNCLLVTLLNYHIVSPSPLIIQKNKKLHPS